MVVICGKCGVVFSEKGSGGGGDMLDLRKAERGVGGGSGGCGGGGGGGCGGGGGDEDDDKDNGGRIGHTRVLHLSQTAQSPPQNDPDKILLLVKVEF